MTDFVGSPETAFEAGQRVRFDTHGHDSALNRLSGTLGTVERPLRQSTPLQSDSEADSVEEVGPMFKVQLDSGETIDAFADELWSV